MELKHLSMSLPEDDQLLIATLKARYGTDDTAEMRLLILNVREATIQESNGIARNVRYVWNMIVWLCMPIFQRRFAHYKQEQNREQHRTLQQKYLRRNESDRSKEISRFRETQH